MNDITVGLGERSYAVRIEAGLLARGGAAIGEVARNRRIAVVGDENVSAHVDTLLASLADAGIVCMRVTPWEWLSWPSIRLMALNSARRGLDRVRQGADAVPRRPKTPRFLVAAWSPASHSPQ